MSTKIAATFEATQRRLPWGFQKASRWSTSPWHRNWLVGWPEALLTQPWLCPRS